MKTDSLFRFSIELDPGLLDNLGIAQRLCLTVVVAIAGVVLTAWFVPALAHALPAGWSLMKVNTALLALCSALSLICSQPRRSQNMIMASQLIAVFIGLLALAVLVEYATGTALHVDTLLPTNPLSAPSGRMSPQTAFCFTLLSVVLFLLRHRKRLGSAVGDVFLSALSVIVLVIASGYLYGALQLFGLSGDNRTAPQTLACLFLLNFVVFGRRAEYGVFGILLGTGIGSRIARVACPIVFFLPFMLEAARGLVVRVGLLHPDYATAVVTALAVLLAFILILMLAWRIDSLERDIRDLSLRDELTRLYNRRGFYLLAEQALRLAQRSRTPFSVLFIDLDNLKQINDTQGHEMGSQFLREVATLLENFVRRSDVVGRVGGDEFVIAGQSSETAMRSMAQRLEEAVAARNALPAREYPFSFSLGLATSAEEYSESLEDLLHRADNAMYANKRVKKQQEG